MNAFPQLETDSFIAWLADNRSLGIHAGGYNGVASLVPRASGNNLFLPWLAGMNLELYRMPGLAPYAHASGNRFEPRCEPMYIESSDAERVVMVQPETSHSHISARTTWTVAEPCFLHKHVELTCHRRFCEDGQANRMVALCSNYMHAVPDRHVYLKTDLGTPALHDWVAITQEDHAAPTLQVYRMPSSHPLSASEHLEFIAGSLAPHEQWPKKTDHPLQFFYGIAHGEQMFLMMFKQPERVRLSYSPCGGGKHPHWSPAWDYVLVEEDAQPGRTYRWDICLAVTPFEGREKVLEMVRRYSES